MIRRYCDICDKEVKRSYVSDRVIGWFDEIGVQIMLGLNGTWNDGEFCLDCIQQAVNKLIDKRREEEKKL